MSRQEPSGPVQRRGAVVKDRVIGLEDVRHPGGDVECDRDVRAGSLSRKADGIVEQHLVCAGLDHQVRQARQVGEADQARSGSMSRRIVGDAGSQAFPAEQRVDLASRLHGRPGQGEIDVR
jgi:hypothetical protein